MDTREPLKSSEKANSPHTTGPKLRSVENVTFYPPPTVAEAVGNALPPNKSATVRPNYQWNEYDVVIVNWISHDINSWVSEPRDIYKEEDLEFLVPPAIVKASANKIVEISYIVIRSGTPSLSRSLTLAVTALEGDVEQFADINFQHLDVGPVPSPLELPAATIEGSNMKISYIPPPYGNYLITENPCTITFTNEISILFCEIHPNPSHFTVKAYSNSGEVVEIYEGEANKLNHLIGKSTEQKIKKIVCSVNCNWTRLIFM